jgi:dipeptidyl aminopeptidase/acylaminoacyl peptidase
MQDDITDGVRWAIEQKLVDPERIAIMGGSYGGYAALMGVITTPELYRCAINQVGVTDLRILTRWGSGGSVASEKYLENWVGKEPEYVRTRSPVNLVEHIRVPTFHAYGFNDPRVDIDHWKRLKAKLVDHKKPFEEFIVSDEGHGFDNAETRIEFYKRVEAFLAKHMPAGG